MGRGELLPIHRHISILEMAHAVVIAAIRPLVKGKITLDISMIMI